MIKQFGKRKELKPQELRIKYDKESDVHYISVGKPRDADESFEPQEGVVFRTREGELKGLQSPIPVSGIRPSRTFSRDA